MRFVNLVGVALVLCQLAFSVSAGSISSSAPPNVYGNIYKDGIRLDNIRVRVEVERICSSSHWQTSTWSSPYGTYYIDLPRIEDAYYMVQVQDFQFGSTFTSCLKYFGSGNTGSVKVDLDIIPHPMTSCTDLPC
jgi:hypothetical protein